MQIRQLIASALVASLFASTASAQVLVQLDYDLTGFEDGSGPADPAGLVGAQVQISATFASSATWSQFDANTLVAVTSDASLTISGASNPLANGTYPFVNGLAYSFNPSLGGWSASNVFTRAGIDLPDFSANFNIGFDHLPAVIPVAGDPVSVSQFTGVIAPAAEGIFFLDDFSLFNVYTTSNATVTAIPEPTSLALLGVGGLALMRRRLAERV